MKHKRNIGTLERNVGKDKTIVTLRIASNLLQKIDLYANKRHTSRSQAIITFLENTQVIIIEEGTEIIKTLNKIDVSLKHSQQTEEFKTIERLCDELWQLLNLITEKIPRQIQNETN